MHDPGVILRLVQALGCLDRDGPELLGVSQMALGRGISLIALPIAITVMADGVSRPCVPGHTILESGS